MAEFDFDGRKVYYKVYGDKGKPIVLLNGIMMTTVDWKPFVKTFSKNNILVLVDFLDQGQSDKMTERYDLSLQVQMLAQLVQRLEFDEINVVGISYGGEVAIGYALQYPHKVRKLVLTNTAGKTSDRFNKIIDGWKEIAKTGNGYSYCLATIPRFYSEAFFARESELMATRKSAFSKYFSRREVIDSLTRLTDSMRDYDCVGRLGEILCPTLVISCSEDSLIPAAEQRLLAKKIKNSTYVTVNGCGHALPYENPSAFCSLALGFVNFDQDMN